jgi:hypothetical protein
LVVAPLGPEAEQSRLGVTARDAHRHSDRGVVAATGKSSTPGAFDAFVKAHRYKGPERLLPEQLAPGN